MFSVLMAIYGKDDPHFLRESIESTLNQKMIPAQIVIMEDGPLSPEIEATLQPYKDNPIFKFVRIEKNGGQAMALNKGIEECDYDFIARMDSDDINSKNRFAQQWEFLQKNPEYDVVGTGILEFTDSPDDATDLRVLPEHHAQILRFSRYRSPVNHATVMYRKSKVLEAGNYHDFLWNDDYHLWARMIKSGANFYNIQDPLLYVRGGPAMYKRRGGWKYAVQDYRLQQYFLKISHVNTAQFLANLCLRVPVPVSYTHLTLPTKRIV